ncbi:hypothetical protein ACFQBY_17805 [Promicromonospora citrea]|uniref:Uncharacterized protein n=1 Tax=Promicromonospora citrea TaxID=43677 RepID=A0A8H9GLT5_9MICO|nr:hypothetical protein [Promicromonospora citrea]GGM37577.1 hypothetical protein GCM10010102_36440 [Promicromonospora citrea]
MPAEPTDLDDAVDALYAGPLDEFVAARDAAARQAAGDGDRLGARRIKRLPKPTVAAWVVNQVVRDRPDEIAVLTDLGDELRAATAERDRARIRALDHLRRERVEGLVRSVRDAGEVGGRAVSQAVLDRLAETLTAAVMDADAGTAVRAGRLTRALQHVGFGIVDEQGEEADLVVLHPGQDDAGGDGADETDADAGSGSAADADTDAEDTDAENTDAENTDAEDADLEAAEREVEESTARLDRVEERRDEVRERKAAADEAARDAQAEVDRLEEEIERLTAERDAAARAVEEARAAVDEVAEELSAVDDELDAAEEQAAAARRRRRAARGR